MTDEEIRKKITAFIRDKYQVPADRVFEETTHIFEEGVVDSFSVNDLIKYLETEFKIQIKEQDFFQGALDSVDRMAALVIGKGGA
jgi:D-alanine--poly(phosphoribitol) ligase subunit 2